MSGAPAPRDRRCPLTPDDDSTQGPRRPLNSVNREGLRRFELGAFGLLFLVLCALTALWGVRLLQGEALSLPFFGLSVPAFAGPAAGAGLIALAAGIALATLAMVLRFRR